MCETQFSRALRLSSASIVNQGASGMSVQENISSFALENSTHFSRDLRSIGLSFQRLSGSCARSWNRRSCSASLTENQYFRRMIPGGVAALEDEHDLQALLLDPVLEPHELELQLRQALLVHGLLDAPGT